MPTVSANERDPQPNTPWYRRLWGPVAQRVLASIVAIPLVLLVIWFGGWWAFAALALVTILGLFELEHMLAQEGFHPLIGLSLLLALAFLLGAMFSAWRGQLVDGGFSAIVVISFTWLILRRDLQGALADWALTLAIPLYIGWPLSFLLLLRGSQPGPVPAMWWTLVVLVTIWGFDTAAFFTGRYLGRHKLLPAISPGKTWEGVAGGLVFAIIAAVVVTRPIGVAWYQAVAIGILTGVAGQIGDLAESLVKRQTHVKDSGRFMPGHGGVLDRVDSLLFATLVVYFYVHWGLHML
jgi:phosphatidate cytidylyltransferase